MTSYKKILLLAFMLATVFAGCKDSWEERLEVSNPSLNGNVLDHISGNPRLSIFNEYLKETGYDKTLTTSRAFTVWAPTNEALQSIDQDIVKDAERLKQFVGNHISYQQYFTHSPLQDTSRILTLSGKYIFWGDAKSKMESAAEGQTRTSDIVASNGVVHLFSTSLTPRPSSWEYLQNSEYGARQASFINSLEGMLFVDSLAPILRINPDTGQPEYDTLAGSIPYNAFLDRGYDISNEDSLNTFIILTDEAFEAEIDKYRQYFETGDEDSTIHFTSLAIVKDLAFRGLYTPDNLPPFMYSTDSVKVTINQGDILHVERTSNGIVYVLDNMDLLPVEKLQPIVIQGESLFYTQFNPENVFSHPDKSGAVRWRVRRNPDTQELYNDLLAYNHDISGFHIRYRLREIYSTTFDVYMTTYNDFNGGTAYNQKIAFEDPAATELPYTNVPAGEYARIYLGQYTVDDFGNLDMYLVGAESTSDAANPLNLDFVELVPVIE